jgi:hypothetical protein
MYQPACRTAFELPEETRLLGLAWLPYNAVYRWRSENPDPRCVISPKDPRRGEMGDFRVHRYIDRHLYDALHN